MDVADGIVREIGKAYGLLSAWPLLGRKRDTLSPGVRSLPVNPYVIFYRVKEDAVQVVRIPIRVVIPTWFFTRVKSSMRCRFFSP